MKRASLVAEQQTTAPVSTNTSQFGGREELKCLFQAIKLLRNNCLQNCVMSESLRECLARSGKRHARDPSESTLPGVIVDKVARLVCLDRLCDYQSVTECRELASDAATNLLGVSWESVAGGGHDLLEKEKQLVRGTVEQQLRKKQHRHLQKFKAYKVSDDNQDSGKGMTENCLYNILLKNHGILQQHWEEMERLLGMRQSFLHQILPQKIAYLENQLELCKVQKRCLDASLLEIILMEVPRFPKALKIVYSQLKEDNGLMVSEIDKSKKLLCEYRKLKGTSFDVLLQEYRCLQNDISQYSWCLHSFK